MDLYELGTFLVERAHNKAVDITLRCLGYTAVSLQGLLDETNDTDEALARWGIIEEETDVQ